MFYECVLLIRPDVSIKQVRVIVQSVQEVIEKEGGSLEGGEYWGFRTLAYRILKKGKAHYVCLGIRLDDLKSLQHYLKFNRELLRFLLIKKPKGLTFPSPLFQAPLTDLESAEITPQVQGEEES